MCVTPILREKRLRKRETKQRFISPQSGSHYRSEKLATPHSKQRALSRDVINPQDGHILCDRNPVICGFSLRILWSSRIVNSTISRPKKMLVAFIKATLLGEFCIDLASRSSRVLTSRS
jgi:hypothetical protein